MENIRYMEPRGIICNKCGISVAAPEFSEDFSEEQVVINFWSCMNCGNRFETEVSTTIVSESEPASNVMKKRHPTLLVA
jgi:ribosomal protein L37AE/L43A